MVTVAFADYAAYANIRSPRYAAISPSQLLNASRATGLLAAAAKDCQKFTIRGWVLVWGILD